MKSLYHNLFISLLSLAMVFMTSCQRESPCDTLECGQYGHCTIDSNGDPVCDCDDGYVGTPCQAIDLCPPGVCENGGTCLIDEFGNAYCDCADGFTGETCSEIDPCIAEACEGNTTCNRLSDGTYECICIDGYEDGDNPPCDVEMREKFIGTYTAQIVCFPTEDPNNVTFDIGTSTISKDPNNVRRIIFDELGFFDTEIYGLVIESNKFVIPIQYAYPNDSTLIRGINEVFIENNAMSIFYKYNNEDGDEMTCQVILF